MKTKCCATWSIVWLTFPLLGTISLAHAADEPPAATTEMALIEPNRPTFFGGVKMWAATWNMPLLDAQVVLPGPVVKSMTRSSPTDMEVIPIASLGVQYDRFTLSGSYFFSTSFSTEDDLATTAKRKEWDVSLGYAILPNLTASIVYRHGAVDEFRSQFLRSITPGSASYTFDAWLLGLSGSAPLQGPLSLYGNFGYGTATEKASGGDFFTATFRGSYAIGELGLSYRLLGSANSGFLRNLSVNLGYRAQTVLIRGVKTPVYPIPVSGPDAVAVTKSDIRSTTDGLVLGIVAAF